MKSVYALLLGVVGLGLVGCHRNKGGDDGPDEHLADAKVLLGALTKPGADQPTLSAALRPKPEDYDAVFVPDAAKKLKAEIDPVWDSGKLVLKPKPGADLSVVSATSDQLKTGTGQAGECPHRYREIADMIKPGNRIYCFRYRKAGDKGGVNADGLVWVKDHWAIFPRSYLYLGTKRERDAPAGSGQAAPAGSGQAPPAQPAPAGSAQP